MGFVGRTELNFNLVPAFCFNILEQQIEPTGPRLNPFFVAENQIPEPQDSRIGSYQALNPMLVESGVQFERKALRTREIVYVCGRTHITLLPCAGDNF